MSRLAMGALIGLAFAASWLLLVAHGLGRRAPGLVERIGPYVRGLHGRRDADRVVRRAAPSLSDLVGRARFDAHLADRLTRAGSALDGPGYRLEQLAWSTVGAGVGIALGLALSHGSATLGQALVLAGLGGAAGALMRGRLLTRKQARRQQEIEAALPTLADLVALCVASGAGPVAAFERSATTLTGPLAHEVGRAMDEVRAGQPAQVALGALGQRTGVLALARFVDALLVSAERGSPLADVARAQATDIRAAQRRRLLAVAGRKEVLMLVPIVVLVLPSVVLVAVFPGVLALRLVVP